MSYVHEYSKRLNSDVLTVDFNVPDDEDDEDDCEGYYVKISMSSFLQEIKAQSLTKEEVLHAISTETERNGIANPLYPFMQKGCSLDLVVEIKTDFYSPVFNKIKKLLSLNLTKGFLLNTGTAYSSLEISHERLDELVIDETGHSRIPDDCLEISWNIFHTRNLFIDVDKEFNHLKAQYPCLDNVKNIAITNVSNIEQVVAYSGSYNNLTYLAVNGGRLTVELSIFNVLSLDTLAIRARKVYVSRALKTKKIVLTSHTSFPTIEPEIKDHETRKIVFVNCRFVDAPRCIDLRGFTDLEELCIVCTTITCQLSEEEKKKGFHLDIFSNSRVVSMINGIEGVGCDAEVYTPGCIDMYTARQIKVEVVTRKKLNYIKYIPNFSCTLTYHNAGS